MSRLHIPKTIEEMSAHLRALHRKRSREIRARKKEVGTPHRKALTRSERKEVLEKTDNRCHLCGGDAEDGSLVADHVLPQISGGKHALNNYLAAHGMCNRYRWMYSPEEFRLILRLGVWARKQMEEATPIGKKMFKRFPKHRKR